MTNCLDGPLPRLQDRLPLQSSQFHTTRLLNLFEAKGLAPKSSATIFGDRDLPSGKQT